MDLEVLRDGVGTLDASAMAAVRDRQDRLTKPPGSLGRLEELAALVAGIQGRPDPRVERKALAVLAGDHGVAAEGVSAYPQRVTREMLRTFAMGRAAVNVLARRVGARLLVADLGCVGPTPPEILDRKVAPGTRNLTREPAMTRDQAEACLSAGAELFDLLREEGVDVIGTGDMGIGNTTASSAVTAAFTGRNPKEVTGRGTGVDDVAYGRKVRAVGRALELHEPDPGDAVDVLAKVGGFEIGGLAGLILAAAGRGCPVVLDGFITAAAALVAQGLQPRVRDFLIASHRSAEPGHAAALAHLGLEPLLDLRLRLGEGTGAALAFFLLDSAVALLREMATFEEAGVSGPGA